MGVSYIPPPATPSGLKTVQRGVASLTSVGSLNVTITAVVMAKARVSVNGQTITSADITYSAHGQLTTTTNLLLTRSNTGAATTAVAWEVEEDY